MPARELIPGSSLPASLAERLTIDFYEWEIRGRGWQVWPYPVELEPPYRPFFFRSLAARARVADDARRPRLFSSVAGGLKGLLRGREPEPAAETALEDLFPEPEPEPFDSTIFSKLAEIQAALPPGSKVAKDASERLILSLGMTSAPVSFEIVGLPDSIAVQLACREEDAGIVRRQIAAHFPDAVLGEGREFVSSRWREGIPALVVDFGLSEEFMRPLATLASFSADPLTGLAGALSDLREREFALIQILFQGIRHPWAESIVRSVLSPDGSPFFENAPEMASLAREKAARPLFAALLRLAVQGPEPARVREIAASIAAALSPLARPGSNELVPLLNDVYDEDLHVEDVLLRETHRSGMILNSEELVSLVHLPSESVRLEKLKRDLKKTKAAPEPQEDRGLVLGENLHRGKTTQVVLPREERLRHMHVLGATGTGKSTFLLNLILQDIRNGEGVGLIDPHGDLVNQVLDRLPEERHRDVVLFDAADADHPVGFNILEARSEGERTLLESDLAALFRRFASTWGDQMHSVLTNTVAAFLRSKRGGTLSDLRRFLLEAPYRSEILGTVKDAAVTYYWTTEFPILKGKPEASIVTRLGTFLRSGVVRNILSQKYSRLDFPGILNGRKVFLGKLAQGEIGEENAYLLGSLLVSKIHQVAIARQSLPESERADWFLYIDEFQNFVTPSLASILSGARKYRLGLVLSHQDLNQLKERSTEVLSSVLGNAGTRVCFRLGAQDAKKLAESFSSFDARDLQNLGRGEAICRIGRSEDDFNVRIPLPAPVAEAEARRNRERVIALSRERYSRPCEEVEAELLTGFETKAPPPPVRETRREREDPRPEKEEKASRAEAPTRTGPEEGAAETPRPRPTASERQAEVPRAERPSPGRGGREHKYLQALVKRLAEDKGFRATIEKEVLGGAGSVDVALEREAVTIACEISVTSTAEYELGNLQKCIAAGFKHVVLISSDDRALERLRKRADAEFTDSSRERIRLLTPQEFIDFLDEIDPGPGPPTSRGYKVKLRRKVLSEEEAKARKQAIAETLLRSSRRQRSKE